MAFRVYEKIGNYLIIKEKEVSLAGKRGPIYSLAMKKIKSYKGSNAVGWEITEEELIEALGYNRNTHKLIIDLKPDDENKVSLFYLKRIFGYSYDKWTPIALQLERIYSDKPVKDVKEFKNKFQIPPVDEKLIHEFLYLQGGFEKGNWVWGRVGGVNGCLLWPDAFKFFVNKISP
ncbi:hypothetical protein J7M23_05120 [Candidatus Sumerlaeota bacterium]|nr:hypothetical protein [Candidatus Sumerlaeota bacterium]